MDIHAIYNKDDLDGKPLHDFDGEPFNEDIDGTDCTYPMLPCQFKM